MGVGGHESSLKLLQWKIGGLENERLKRLTTDEHLKLNVQRKGAQGTENELIYCDYVLSAFKGRQALQ